MATPEVHGLKPVAYKIFRASGTWIYLYQKIFLTIMPFSWRVLQEVNRWCMSIHDWMIDLLFLKF